MNSLQAGRARLHNRRIAALHHDLAAAACDALKHVAAALQLGQDLLDRPAGHELASAQKLMIMIPKQAWGSQAAKRLRRIYAPMRSYVRLLERAGGASRVAPASASYHQLSSSAPVPSGGTASG